MRWLVVVVLCLAAPAYGGDGRPIVGFKARGETKVHDRMLGRLLHLEVGMQVSPDQIPQLEQTLLSSELFEQVAVTLEDAPDGVIVVATLHDKMSWIAAPTVYLLPSTWAVGAGFAENNLLGEDKKLLLYGQIGNRTSLFFGTYLDPAVDGSPLQLRFDIYAYRKVSPEYLNPEDDPRNDTIARESNVTFLDVGALIGWRFNWYTIGDLRLRGAYVYYTDVHDPAPNAGPVPPPEVNGWDISTQARVTFDARYHRYGVSWGPYAQVMLDTAIPGIGTYNYTYLATRAYYSWRLFGSHELELRTNFGVGRHLPFQEEFTLGGAGDLRGYAVEQFRGDFRLFGRAEYSVPITTWRFLSFRALGFWDSGFIGYRWPDPSGMRNYLPTQFNGAGWFRNDVGAGFRIYVSSIVLPLLGLDVGYGIEARSPEVYFELGLTDF